MVKKILILVVLAIAGIYLFLFSDIEMSNGQNHQTTELTKPDMQNSESSQVSLQSEPALATSPTQQNTENQCDNNLTSFSQKVGDIHQILISALQHELKQGKTPLELLAYSDQYQTFYQSYPDLLWEAQIRNEQSKYQITRSANILAQWQGLTVIAGLSEDMLPMLVESLNNIEGQLQGLNMELSLNRNISKADIYQLLDNDQTFNTYLQSPLSIAGSPVISPSILFVLTAKNLSIDEFTEAVSRRSFTVNDAAVAINNELPTDYLQLLLQHTTAISDMPVFAFNRHDAYANLADLAAAKHNVALLEILEKYGVRPTNEPGHITGLDIAILNLPRDTESYQPTDTFPQKYLETLQYLKSKGYRAHGSRDPLSSEKDLIFKSPNKRHFTTAQMIEPELKTFMQGVELIDSNNFNPQASQANPAMAKALSLVRIRRDELEQRSADCQQQKAQKLAEESFLNQQNIRQLIDEVKLKGGDIPQQLHQIDPALVNIWQEYELVL